jgi:hypothetical protein
LSIVKRHSLQPKVETGAAWIGASIVARRRRHSLGADLRVGDALLDKVIITTGKDAFTTL